MKDLEYLLKLMVEKKASDLYLKVDAPPTYRLQEKEAFFRLNEKLTAQDTQNIAEIILKNETLRKTFYKNQEIDLSFSLDGIGRFRCNIYKQKGTIGIVLRRVISEIPTIEELNLPPILKELALETRGLVLIAGAAGSGKTTTLASMVDYRNQTKEGHIITIEDPIEFLHKDKKSMVSQREVGIDTENFSKALKHALRQTPDVIVIGEMRDKESMDASVFFAETGHLVLSSLHSIDAQGALQRIIQFYPSTYHQQIFMQIALNLKAVIAQRLIQRQDAPGRIPATEILVNTPRIKDLIKRGEIDQIKKAIEAGVQEGMHTFDQDLFRLYKEGKISLENALAYADSVSNLKLKIKLTT
jgi:twitching motility protein PilU